MKVAVSADDLAYLTALVRERDRARYSATLFIPTEARADFFALYGFAAEIARVPDQVTEPALGEIRLRWWQDALADAVRVGEGSTPALRAVAATIARHRLPLAPFDALIEARSADLYSDPPATLADVEGRMGEMESALFQMTAIVLGAAGPETAEAAGHAGVAYGIARRLAAFASERARGRTVLPADLLARHGLVPNDIFVAAPAQQLAAAISDMAGTARRHLGLARNTIAKLPAQLRAAFLPLVVAEPLLRGVERRPALFERQVELSDLGMLARIGRARLLGR